MTHRKKVAYYLDAMARLSIEARGMRGGMDRPTLTATFYVWAKMDPDNAVARLKWPIDCLVQHGLLVDDSEKHLDFTQIPKQVIDRKNQRVEIELTPLEREG